MSEDIIKVCMGSSCFSRGNKENLTHIKEYLSYKGIESKIVLTGNLCDGSCNSGPIITFNDRTYKNVSPSEISDVLKEVFEDGNNVPS